MKKKKQSDKKCLEWLTEMEKQWPGVPFDLAKKIPPMTGKGIPYPVTEQYVLEQNALKKKPDLADEYIKKVQDDLKKEARKDDAEKTRLDLLSVPALLGISDVLTHGAKKYADNNWRSSGGLEWHRLIRAALKHLLAFQAGEDLDAESGLPHIDHLLCCAMFLSEYQKTGLGKDDRWKVKGKFS